MSRVKKKHKNNAGFSLVELLAVITIIGVLATLATVSIMGLLKSARVKYYRQQEDSVVEAGMAYFQNNKELVPKVKGQINTVSLRDLKNNKYIDSVKDYNKNNCNLDDSYVQIYKYSNKNYSYTVQLVCDDYENKMEEYNSNLKASVKLEGNISDAKATLTMSDDHPQGGISSYFYTIYTVENSKETEVYKSEVIDGHLSRQVITKKVSLSKYTPAKVKIKLTVINKHGASITVTNENNYEDNTPPKCVKGTGESTSWTKNTRTITVGCNDQNGVGCVRDKYTKQFASTTTKGTIKICDKANKCTDCQVNVYVDKTVPTKPKVDAYTWKNNSTKPANESGLSKYTSDKWTNKKVYIKASGSSDEHSKGIYYEFKTSGAAGNSTNKVNSINIEREGKSKVEVRACDKVGNCSGYTTIKVNVDYSNPTCGNYNNTTTWTNQDKTVTLKCNDSVSGCRKNEVSKSFNSTIKTSEVNITDNAGNSATCPINVYLDKTPPSCGNNNGSTEWVNWDREVVVDCNDSDSQCQQSQFKQTFNYDVREANITIRDNAGNTANCGVNAYVDKQGPSVPDGYIGDIWGSDVWWNVNEAWGSNDNGSGVQKYLYCIRQNDGNWPDKWDGCFGDNRSYARSCGTTTYAYAVALDNLGNRSDVKYLGSTSDSGDWYSDWGSCSAECGGGVRYRSNSCSLVTWGLSEACNTHSCVPTNTCKLRGKRLVHTSYTWQCRSAKHRATHNTGYVHYCSDSNGNLYVRDSEVRRLVNVPTTLNTSLVKFTFVCPTYPYDEDEGYTLIDD